MVEQLTVRIHGCDGSLWTVYGQGAGKEGVWMAKDQVEGFFAAPVRSEWKAGARQRGGKPKGRWFDWRDLKLGFHLVSARVPGMSQEDLMSRFRAAFSFDLDEWDHDAVLAKIEVITDTSTRFLDVQEYKNEDFNPGLDPLHRQHSNHELLLRAGQPFYYEPDVITKFSVSGTSGSGTIKISNPTDVLMYQKFIGTRGQWVLPDVSWAGKKHHRAPGVSKLTGRDDSERAILMPLITEIQGGFTVDLDPGELMVRDAHRTNLLGQMPVPGMYFEYPIPPHTPETMLPVSVTGAPASGAMLQCVQPRLWQWPIGGQQ